MAIVTVNLRPMDVSDIPAAVELELRVFAEPWSAGVFADELAIPSRRYLVAEGGDGVMIGYGGLLVMDQDAHITTLAVAPEARGIRLGTRLMLALADTALGHGAEHLTLEVRASNQAAQRLYARFGFSQVGVRKNYYRDEDAVVMWAIDIAADEYRSRLADIRSTLT